MKLFKLYTASVLVATTLLCLTGCEDKDTLSRAVIASVSDLFFDANGGSVEITIYADEDWISTYPKWVTVTPDTGNRVSEVTITVGSNYTNGIMDTPRSGELVFKGSTIASEYHIAISQTGDRYGNLTDYTVDELCDLEVGDFCSVPSAFVCAIAPGGYIISDRNPERFIFAEGEGDFEVGDEISILGEMSSVNGLLEVVYDTYEVLSVRNTITRPTPVDITNEVDTYKSTSWDYISVSGGIRNLINVMEVTDAQFSVNILNEIDSDYLGHSVTLTGFYAGSVSPYVRIIVDEVTDNGSIFNYYFTEDWTWLMPWIESDSSITDPVGDDLTGMAANRTQNIKYNGVSAQQAIVDMGYVCETCNGNDGSYNYAPDVYNPIYLFNNYLLFGTTSYSSALHLYPFEVPEGVTPHISFMWTEWRTGAKAYYNTQIVVRVTNTTDEGEAEVTDFYVTPRVQTSVWTWIDVDMELTGVTITKDTDIQFRPIDSQWAVVGSMYAFYLDNIAVYSEAY